MRGQVIPTNHVSPGDEISASRYPNFDAIRVFAALTVLFSHSFVITEGKPDNEPLVRLLGPGNLLGSYGVFIFFIVSGFLITRSFLSSRSAARFLAKRCLRIFPGLILCSLICAFVIGPLMTNLPLAQYFGQRAIYGYVAKTVLLFDTSGRGLPGVVFASHEDGTQINGSIWSLGPEFLCYMVTLLLGVTGLLRRWTAVVLVCFGVLSYHYFGGSFGFIANVGYIAIFFASGMLQYFVFETVGSSSRVGILCALAIVCAALLGREMEALAFAVFGSYLVIGLGTTRAVRLWNGARFGDLSYGLYLYGWPIEECVKRVAGDAFAWWQIFLVSAPLVASAAWMSWHAVEKRALRIVSRSGTADALHSTGFLAE